MPYNYYESPYTMVNVFFFQNIQCDWSRNILMTFLMVIKVSFKSFEFSDCSFSNIYGSTTLTI